MSNEEKLAKVMRMSGESDALVAQDYLDIAHDTIMNRRYPFGYDPLASMPAQYASLHVEVAVFLLNKRGAEGQTNHSENGVNRSYEGGSVPESMLSRVIPLSKVLEVPDDEPSTEEP